MKKKKKKQFYLFANFSASRLYSNFLFLKVYAKQKGLPYWPAKVIRTIPDGSYDIRFFGGQHQRALVEKQNVRPISVNIQTLQVKRTSLWNKASEELKKHQEFVTKVKNALPDFQKDSYGDPYIGKDTF